MFSDPITLMMPEKRYAETPLCTGSMASRPAPHVCVACIQESAGALSNVERIMAGQEGEAVGLKLQTTHEARKWIRSLDQGRCPCLTVNKYY